MRVKVSGDPLRVDIQLNRAHDTRIDKNLRGDFHPGSWDTLLPPTDARESPSISLTPPTYKSGRLVVVGLNARDSRGVGGFVSGLERPHI